jgi:hypothetical protein
MRTLEQSLRLLDKYISRPTRRQRRLTPDKRHRRGHVSSILSMLRGPDRPGSFSLSGMTLGLKELTTSRIRSVLLGMRDDGLEAGKAYASISNGWVFNQTPLTKRQKEVRNKLLNEGLYHFKGHYSEACEAILRIFDYDIMEDEAGHLYE